MDFSLNFEELDNYLLEQKRFIIHQIWFDTITSKYKAKKLYEELKHCRESWDILNPNFCHIIWNRENTVKLIKSFYPEFYELFVNYPFEIQRCDMIRYCILHRYSGIYVDMDYKCKKSFQNVFKLWNQYDIYLINSSNVSGKISNSMMLSYEKNHMFWKMVLLEMNKIAAGYKDVSKHLQVMYTTGPAMLSKMYNIYRFRYKIGLLPTHLFNPLSIEKKILDKDEEQNVYAIHLGKGSWESTDSKIFILFYINWKIILSIVIILIFPQILLKIF